MADAEDSFLSRWSRRKAVARAGVVLPEPAVATAQTPAGLQARPQPVPGPAPTQAPVTPTATEPPGARTPSAAAVPDPSAAQTTPPQAPPPPTLADVAALTRDSDYSRFVAGNVAPEVKNAALKQLFTDPHFNVMDGLDIYIGDYNTPDPLPPGMLRQMVQSQLLGIFDDEKDETAAAQPAGPGAPDAPHAPAAEPPLDDTLASARERIPEAPPQTSQGPAPALSDEDPDLQLQPDDGAGRPAAEPGPVPDTGRPH